MSLNNIFSILAGLLFLFAFFPYVRSIVVGKTVPKKVTWLIWALNDVIVLSGMFLTGKVNGLIVGATLGAVIVFCLSIKKGENGWDVRDKLCVTISLMAIVGSFFSTKNVGIALSLSALFIAAWPMYVSAWKCPEKEDAKSWVIFNTANLFGVLAISSMTFASVAPPVMFVVIDSTMLYLLLVRPRLRLVK